MEQKTEIRTRGEVEAEISEAVVRFEMDYMGRGPKEVRTYIIEDMIVVRLKGVLTPAEQQLINSADGVELIKRMRAKLIENVKPVLFRVIGEIAGAKVTGLLTDISAVTGERVLVFILERDIQKELPRKKTS